MFTTRSCIVYFSMEIGLDPAIPTYSGGLGILAGDTIKSAADLNLRLVGVTLLTKKGYFEQEIDADGNQIERESQFDPSVLMQPLDMQVTVRIEGRDVLVQPWVHMVKSLGGGQVPVIFLDTDIPANTPEDRTITHHLYGGGSDYRLKQEVVLGVGGIRVIDELGLDVRRYHMNEGHSALLTLELLNRFKRPVEEVWDENLVWDDQAVKEKCVFTTHTPVEAGHDSFEYRTVSSVLGDDYVPQAVMRRYGGRDRLNMTYLAMNLSEYVNGVAKKHGEVSRRMFPGYEINAITNGVHSYTWVCESMARVYDKYIHGWANEPEIFVRVGQVPDDVVREARTQAKRRLFDYIKASTGVEYDPSILTIGFARRSTAYKRPDLLFHDIDRLLRIGAGRIQLVYAGKAHPNDLQGKEIIRRIHELSRRLDGSIKLVFLKNYNMALAKLLVAGVDIWLNTPQRPLEASGTSGMKAAHNGVINFSVLDGWWIEGYIEGITGWAIGAMPTEDRPVDGSCGKDADDLYDKLENEIIPIYYDNPGKWMYMVKNSIAKVAYYFNTHRMMRRYVTEAYFA